MLHTSPSNIVFDKALSRVKETRQKKQRGVGLEMLDRQKEEGGTGRKGVGMKDILGRISSAVKDNYGTINIIRGTGMEMDISESAGKKGTLGRITGSGSRKRSEGMVEERACWKA